MGAVADNEELNYDYNGFAARLRTCRQSARLSQQELAERSGLSVRAIGNLERGRVRWPFQDTVSRLAAALGLSGTDRTEFVSAAHRRLAFPTASSYQAAVPPGPRSGPATVPRQLPAVVADFTGRLASLAALTGRWEAARTVGGAVVISAIGGTAGVGKTALALRWAHARASDFPDGQLYVNLRGYDPGRRCLPATRWPASCARSA